MSTYILDKELMKTCFDKDSISGTHINHAPTHIKNLMRSILEQKGIINGMVAILMKNNDGDYINKLKDLSFNTEITYVTSPFNEAKHIYIFHI